METTRTNILILFALVLMSAAMFYCGAIAGHQAKVIHDQREYIELGCGGRYQGED